MSSGASIHEKLTIHNDCPQARTLIERLQAYIQQINHMACLESISYLRLTLSDGTDTVHCDSNGEYEPGNTWLMTEDGIRQRRMDHEIWAKDHPLMKMLAFLEKARKVEFECDISIMSMYGAAYGYQYWFDSIKAVAPTDCVTYRTMETNDFDTCARAVEDHGTGEFASIPRDQPLDAVSDIRQWFCFNFSFSVSGVAESAWEPFEESMESVRKALEGYFDEDCLDVDVYEGSATMLGAFDIAIEHMDELASTLQSCVDIAAEFGAEVEMEMEFEPDETGKGRFLPFALIHLAQVGGRVALSACRYDG